mgnify:CR=1 FL=1
MGVKILGTSAENVDAAEDRELFDAILEECHIPRPKGHTVYTAEEAKKAANELGYPVLVRPSMYWADRGCRLPFMTRTWRSTSVLSTALHRNTLSWLTKYLQGKEIEVDAVCEWSRIF